MSLRPPNPASLPSRPRPVDDAGFTLIELLVVITIIAILTGLIFTAGPAIMKSTRKATAEATATSLVTAIKDYKNDHSQWPMAKDRQGKDTIFGNPTEDQRYSTKDILDILLAEDDGWNSGHKLNKGKKVYFQPKLAQRAGGQYRNGLGEDGRLYDPWGREYLVMIDGDYDGEFAEDWFEDLFQYEDAKQEFGGVVVWSYGKDGEMGKKGDKMLKGSDDVASWK